MEYRSVAREIRDQLVAELASLEPSFPVQHPGRNRAVLACRCGRVLDARDMVRIRTPSKDFRHDTSTVIYRIGCRPCAAQAAGMRSA